MFIRRSELFDIMSSSESSDSDQQFNFLSEEIKKRTKCKLVLKLKKKYRIFYQNLYFVGQNHAGSLNY